MNFKDSLREARNAAKANLRPALFLWTVLLLFLLAYLLNEPFRQMLMKIAEFKSSSGYTFSFTVYVLFAAVLPELLQIVFFQKGKGTRANLSNIGFGALVWGGLGVCSDLFYQGQAYWFGEGTGWQTLTVKVAVDQFVFTPLNNSVIIPLFMWRDAKFKSSVFRKVFSLDFLTGRLFPVLVALWCVWIPSVFLIYSMPTALQLPIASMILCFWVLIFTFIRKRREGQSGG